MPTTGTELIDRAIAAAEDRRADDADAFRNRHDNWPQWSRRAATARAIATAFEIGVESVRVTDDGDRRYGVAHQYAGDLITVTCPSSGEELRFVPDFSAHGHGWLLLHGCPGCHRPVPVARVATLADLGAYCAADSDSGFGQCTPDFRDDPAHRPDCRLAAG